MQRLRVQLACIVTLALSGAAVPRSASAALSMRINRVGLFTDGSPLVREGEITFAEVALRNTGATPFDGLLRLTQLDRDGDVVISELPVAVAPDGEWEPRELYFVPNFRAGNETLKIRLYNSDGEIVAFENTAGESVRLLESAALLNGPSGEDLLIVHMSSGRRAPHAEQLEFKNHQLEFTSLVTSRDVRGVAPTDIPRRPQGLFAVDALIWEDADPGTMQPEQLDAIAGWVRGGGRLLVTVGSHWQSVNASSLRDLLPVRITGADDTDSAPAMANIVRNDALMAELAAQYAAHPFIRCVMQPRDGAIPIPSDPGADKPIGYRAHVGRGLITVIGARLNDLLPPPRIEKLSDSEAALAARARFVSAVEKVVGNNFLALPGARDASQAQMYFMGDSRNLFSALTRTISFSALTIAFLFFAIGFAGVYTFTATIGSYLLLKRKSLERHCWTAFTVVTVAGLVIGLGMVWVLRGFSTKVLQTNVIDARANENYAHGTCLFGVKTNDHTRLDVRLPVGTGSAAPGDGVLFALPEASSFSMHDSTFVASESYTMMNAGTALRGVPVRATLKEFQGFWHGAMGGTLDARLVLDSRTRRFTSESYIRNNLGVTLADCYLLEGDQDIAGEGGRELGIRCHPLQRIGGKAPDSELAGDDLISRLYDKGQTDGSGAPQQRTGIDVQLREYIKVWQRDSNVLWAAGQTKTRDDITVISSHAPFLLLSVYNLMDSQPGAAWTLKRSFGRRLDCSHWITRNTAVLIGFSSDPAPVTLEIDRVSERAEQSVSVYRILIPVERR